MSAGKIEVSAFSTKNRRVRFLDQKSTCRFSNGKSTFQLFQRKIDVSAFPTKPTTLSDTVYTLKMRINIMTLICDYFSFLNRQPYCLSVAILCIQADLPYCLLDPLFFPCYTPYFFNEGMTGPFLYVC